MLGQRPQKQLGIEVTEIVDHARGAEIREREREVQRIGVTHRHHEQRGVLAGELHVERAHECDERTAGVIADGALRLARRTRRVHERPRVLGRDTHRRCRCRCLGNDGLVSLPPGRCLLRPEVDEAGGRHPQAATYRLDPLDEVALRDKCSCVAVRRDVLDLRGNEAKVDGDRDHPRARERDVELHPLDAVEGEQRDTIALDEAEVRERVGKARRALVPLRERQRTAGIAHRDLVRLQPCVRRDDLGNGQQMTHGWRRARSASSQVVSAW